MKKGKVIATATRHENKSGYIRYVLYALSIYSDLGFACNSVDAELRTVAESRSSDEDKSVAIYPPRIRLDSLASDTLTFGYNTVPKDNS